ncbi:MAG: hypothetical protein MUP03_07670 [Anaerolineales bacterium]|nr:hypothetical protein [Anaerolineales bacterium]
MSNPAFFCHLSRRLLPRVSATTAHEMSSYRIEDAISSVALRPYGWI